MTSLPPEVQGPLFSSVGVQINHRVLNLWVLFSMLVSACPWKLQNRVLSLAESMLWAFLPLFSVFCMINFCLDFFFIILFVSIHILMVVGCGQAPHLPLIFHVCSLTKDWVHRSDWCHPLQLHGSLTHCLKCHAGAWWWNWWKFIICHRFCARFPHFTPTLTTHYVDPFCWLGLMKFCQKGVCVQHFH